VTGDPGGVGGFIDHLKGAGLGNLVSSWLGRTDAAPLSVPQVESALGKGTLDRIAQKLGLSRSVVGPALAYLVPKIIGFLTPDGRIPTGIPPQVSAFLSQPSGAPRAAATPPVATPVRSGGVPRWLWPLLALLVLGGLAWWFWGKPAEKVATTPPAVTQTAPTVQPKLGVSNMGGKIQYTGVVADEKTRSDIVTTLKNVFGEGNIDGQIAVDPNAGPATWLDKLGQALEKFKIPGVQALFEGNSISLGGLLPKADLDGIKASLQSIFGPGFTFKALPEDASAWFQAAKEKTLAALGGLKPGFTSADFVSALNLSIINFETGSAAISPESRDLLAKVAATMKQLPPGSVIEISGHTDSTGDPAANLTLSQQRADAVRDTLIAMGMPAETLKAKGYGDTEPVASNDTPEGRFQNRRISYSVVQ
jgi:outer membrane protein OmpA-like peptidoglycan-associated protein